jgi:hypothetical protein
MLKSVSGSLTVNPTPSLPSANQHCGKIGVEFLEIPQIIFSSPSPSVGPKKNQQGEIDCQRTEEKTGNLKEKVERIMCVFNK